MQTSLETIKMGETDKGEHDKSCALPIKRTENGHRALQFRLGTILYL